MYCPRCGQQQISDEIRFCSRCGFLLTGISEVVANGGQIPEKYLKAGNGKNSPRKRGVRHGAMLFLSGILIVPLIAIIFVGILKTPPYFVALAALLTFVGGLLRMIYALLLESGDPADKTLEENVIETGQKLLNKQQNKNALPPEQSIPTSAYVPPTAGNWRDTNDLEPPSVTEKTTRLLHENKE